MFSLTRASSQWPVLETILGLKIPRPKNPALEICSLLQAGKQAVKRRMGILLAALLLLCRDQSGAGLLTWFSISLATNQLKITTMSLRSLH